MPVAPQGPDVLTIEAGRPIVNHAVNTIFNATGDAFTYGRFLCDPIDLGWACDSSTRWSPVVVSISLELPADGQVIDHRLQAGMTMIQRVANCKELSLLNQVPRTKIEIQWQDT